MSPTSVISRALVAVATVAATAACGMAIASATPATFPDLGDYADVDAAVFVRPFSYAERWANGYVFFRTPDGTSCAIGGSSWCTGDFPGFAAQSCGSVRQDDVTGPFALAETGAACVPSADRILEPGQKVTNQVYGITCAVGEGNLTACLDTRHDHGFVLQPSGSWAF